MAADHVPAGLPPVSLVVAVDEKMGIGKGGTLPWNLPKDMEFFRTVTTETRPQTHGRTSAAATPSAPAREVINAVIMGRKTWASIPVKHRPLRRRLNVVLSTSPNVRSEEGIPDDVVVASSLPEALRMLARDHAAALDRVFVIGGSQAFAQALRGDGVVCETVYVTRIHRTFDCDVFLAPLEDETFALTESQVRRQLVYGAAYVEDALCIRCSMRRLVCNVQPRQEENGITFQFQTYRNRRLCRLERSPRLTVPIGSWAGEHEEMQYLTAIRDIITTGVIRDDRTGVGTISKFGLQMRFSLEDEVLPLLTTKRVFWRGVAEELLWFISGNTSAKALQDKGIKIWDGNASREFLDKVGLAHREIGDLGPVYGFQWRHFGAAYKDMHTDYTGCGVDQLADVIHKIKTNPMDRRIVLTAWNPAALHEMALPPCHMFAQFYVHDGKLSCQMYQRSGDMGLGVPFNIASYSLLTRLIAQVTGLKASEFVHVLGDAHVYKNHVDPLLQQLERTPKPFPKLRIDPSITDIEAFRFEHLTVEGYDPHPPIKMEMAV